MVLGVRVDESLHRSHLSLSVGEGDAVVVKPVKLLAVMRLSEFYQFPSSPTVSTSACMPMVNDAMFVDLSIISSISS